MAEVKIGFVERLLNKAIYNTYNANNALHDMVSEIPAKFKAKGNSSTTTNADKPEGNKPSTPPKTENTKRPEQKQSNPVEPKPEKKGQDEENIVIENDFVCNGPDFSKFAEDNVIDAEVISEEDLREVTEEDLLEAIRKSKNKK